MVLLTQTQIEETMKLLTEEQKKFLDKSLKQKRKSQWLQKLAEYKGVDITPDMTLDDIEDIMNDWILVDFLDGGYMQRPFKCECGQALRYQYIIQNKKEGTVHKLGENCFEKYISLPPTILKDIKSGMYNINLERDEIISKYKNKLFFPLSKYLHLQIPSDIIQQHEIGLPLTETQINLVERINETYKEEKKLATLFDRLNAEQKAFVSKLTQRKRRELLLKLEDGFIKELIPDEDIPNYDDNIKLQIELQLPLLSEQIHTINKLKYMNKRNKLLNQLNTEQKEWVQHFPRHEQDEILKSLNKTEYYKIGNPQGIPINKEISKHIQLKLPLLKRHFSDLYIAKQKIKEDMSGSKLEIAFGLIMNRHLETLKEVRKKEDAIPPGLRKDWVRIQEFIRNLQNKQDFDYSTFKLLLTNLLIPLGIDKDPYL